MTKTNAKKPSAKKHSKRHFVVVKLSQKDLDAMMNVINNADMSHYEWEKACGKNAASKREADCIRSTHRLFLTLSKAMAKQTCTE